MPAWERPEKTSDNEEGPLGRLLKGPCKAMRVAETQRTPGVKDTSPTNTTIKLRSRERKWGQPTSILESATGCAVAGSVGSKDKPPIQKMTLFPLVQ